jgi:hypothetical protein
MAADRIQVPKLFDAEVTALALLPAYSFAI